MKTTGVISIFMVLVMLLSVFSITGMILAQDQPPATPPAEAITLSTQYPSIDGLATDTFKYSVELNYTGSTAHVFDLKTTAPQNWSVTITPLYDTSKQISSISMDSSSSGATQDIQVSVSYTNWPLPDPGEYKMNLQAVSGGLLGSIDLIMRVTARYSLTTAPADNLYSLNAKSDHDTIYPVTVTNTGTAPIESITFSSDQIEGWSVTFSPVQIDSLASLESRTVNVDIKPAPKTVSGDYMLNVWATGKQASADKMALRITVETPTIWGWVGVIIIIIVVLGLVLVFMRFGRR